MNWHQQRAARRNPAPLWHETKWTVVHTTPNGTSVSRHNDMGEAYEHATKTGGYVLAPGARMRRRGNG